MSKKRSPIGYRVTRARTGAQIEADEKKARAAAAKAATAAGKESKGGKK